MEYVTTWERKGIQIGLEKGRREGRQEGAVEAFRSVLLDVLATRFGDSDRSVARRIGCIDSIAELRALTRRAVNVRSLSDLNL